MSREKANPGIDRNVTVLVSVATIEKRISHHGRCRPPTMKSAAVREPRPIHTPNRTTPTR